MTTMATGRSMGSESMPVRIFLIFIILGITPATAAHAQTVTGRGMAVPTANKILEQKVLHLETRVDGHTSGIAGNSLEIQQISSQVEAVIRALCPTCSGPEDRPDGGGIGESRALALPACRTGEFLTSDGISLRCATPSNEQCQPGEVRGGWGARDVCVCNLGTWQCSSSADGASR